MFGHQSDCSSLGDPVVHLDRCKEVGLRQWMLDLPRPFLSSSGSLDVVWGLQDFCTLASSRLCGSCLLTVTPVCARQAGHWASRSQFYSPEQT